MMTNPNHRLEMFLILCASQAPQGVQPSTHQQQQQQPGANNPAIGYRTNHGNKNNNKLWSQLGKKNDNNSSKSIRQVYIIWQFCFCIFVIFSNIGFLFGNLFYGFELK